MSFLKKKVVYGLIAFLLILILGFGVLLYLGIATVVTTVLFYIFVFMCGSAVSILADRYFGFKTPVNLKLMLSVFCVCLLLGDLALRFVFKQNLTYTEKICGIYKSDYSGTSTERIVKNYISGKERVCYIIGPSGALKSYSVEGHKFYHRYNSMGLRDNETVPALDDTANLIIGLGDSFTEGVGTGQDSTWLKFMAEGLISSGWKNLRTLNAGVSGSDVFFEYNLLGKILQQFHPEMVVLAINSSDIDDIIIQGGRNRCKPDGSLQYNKPPGWEKLYATSFIFRAIMHSTTDLDWTLLTKAEKELKKREAIDSIRFCITRFHDLSNEKRFKLVVVFQPREEEIISGNFPFDSLAAELSKDTAYSIVNLQQEFRRTGTITALNSGGFYWSSDLHFNAHGYKVWGDIMSAFLSGKQAP